jgi:hypothetical protein
MNAGVYIFAKGTNFLRIFAKIYGTSLLRFRHATLFNTIQSTAWLSKARTLERPGGGIGAQHINLGGLGNV